MRACNHPSLLVLPSRFLLVRGLPSGAASAVTGQHVNWFYNLQDPRGLPNAA
jgi:hypothetical protein